MRRQELGRPGKQLQGMLMVSKYHRACQSYLPQSVSNYSLFTVLFSLCKLFLLGFVIEGFHAQNENNKQIDVEEIKDLCNKVFVCIYTVYIQQICKENQLFFRNDICEIFIQYVSYLRKFCPRKSHDLCTLFGHLIRLLWLWSLALIYLTAGILNTNVCGYHPLTYLFNVYKLKKKQYQW